MKVLSNTAVFIAAYLVCMVPTYILPYFGSNSAMLAASAAASGQGLLPQFWLHLLALAALVVIAWFRGAIIGKPWLAAFPAIAAAFDMLPGLSVVPMVPTLLHILALVKGTSAEAANTAVTTKPTI